MFVGDCTLGRVFWVVPVYGICEREGVNGHSCRFSGVDTVSDVLLARTGGLDVDTDTGAAFGGRTLDLASGACVS